MQHEIEIELPIIGADERAYADCYLTLHVTYFNNTVTVTPSIREDLDAYFSQLGSSGRHWLKVFKDEFTRGQFKDVIIENLGEGPLMDWPDDQWETFYPELEKAEWVLNDESI